MDIVTILICCFTLFYESFAACPTNWTSFDNRCYHFSHDQEEWTNAKFLCSLWKSSLISVNTPEEQFFIQRYAIEHHSNTFWLGGSDFDQQGTWQWQDGTEAVFVNWDAGEPNNHHGDENCMAMDRNAHYAWVDKTCQDDNGYICEKPEDQTTSLPGIVG